MLNKPFAEPSKGGDKARKTEVPCAYCDGKGRDPFRLPSPLATCGVCGGAGVVPVDEPFRRCAFCGGSGRHPNSRLTCTACKGKGVSPVKEPVGTCPVCDGRGQDPRGDLHLFCTTCHGTGVVSV